MTLAVCGGWLRSVASLRELLARRGWVALAKSRAPCAAPFGLRLAAL
jgi:hypothetical protein